MVGSANTQSDAYSSSARSPVTKYARRKSSSSCTTNSAMEDGAGTGTEGASPLGGGFRPNKRRTSVESQTSPCTARSPTPPSSSPLTASARAHLARHLPHLLCTTRAPQSALTRAPSPVPRIASLGLEIPIRLANNVEPREAKPNQAAGRRETQSTYHAPEHDVAEPAAHEPEARLRGRKDKTRPFLLWFTRTAPVLFPNKRTHIRVRLATGSYVSRGRERRRRDCTPLCDVCRLHSIFSAPTTRS